MNPVRQYDRGAALIASMISRAFGGKATANDFMPYGKEEDKVVNDEEFTNLLKLGGQIGKRR